MALPAVRIDSGLFKYVLVKCSEALGGKERFLVRGFVGCQYHADVFERLEEEVAELPHDARPTLLCMGGGRIEHKPGKINIYGYSQAYGRADHAMTERLCKETFGGTYTITWSNDGY